MGKPTPGPWRVCKGSMKWDSKSDALLVDAGQSTSDIAWIPQRFEDLPDMESAQQANARLIAAAPDLLAAAQNAVNVLAALATGQLKAVTPDSPAIAQLRTAIAKAKGN